MYTYYATWIRKMTIFTVLEFLGQTRVFSSTAFWATLSKSPGSASTRLQWAKELSSQEGPQVLAETELKTNKTHLVDKKRSFERILFKTLEFCTPVGMI